MNILNCDIRLLKVDKIISALDTNHFFKRSWKLLPVDKKFKLATHLDRVLKTKSYEKMMEKNND